MPVSVSVPAPALVSVPVPETTPLSASVVPVAVEIEPPPRLTPRLEPNVAVVDKVPPLLITRLPVPRFASAET